MAKPTCTYEGCQYPQLARGLCSTHYRWWRKDCDPSEIKVFFAPTIDRWMAKVHIGEFHECWDWLDHVNTAGYGIIVLTSTRKKVRAHRFGYEHFRGPIPEGLEARHTCDRPICCNPWHVEPGTPARNMRDAAERGRMWRGPRPLKTHCKWGHPYDEANTYIGPDGHRVCRQCIRDRAAKRAASLKSS